MTNNYCRQQSMSCMHSEIVTSRIIALKKLTRSRLMYRKNWRRQWLSLMELQAGNMNWANLSLFIALPFSLHTLFVGVIISCRRLGLFGQMAQLDSDDPARDALECAYARRIEIRLSCVGLEKTTRTSKAVLIGDGSAASILHKWDLDVDIPGERDRHYRPLPSKQSDDDDDDDDVCWSLVMASFL